MAISISATGTRTTATQAVPVTISIGDLPTVGNDTNDSVALPVTYRDFVPTPFSLTGLTVVSGAATFTPTAQDVAKLRVGDIIATTSAGTVLQPAPSTYTRTAHVYHTQNFIVLTGSSTLPKPGDAISGTGIGASAIVTRVEVAARTVHLSVASTESSLVGAPVTITITPAVRIVSINPTTRLVTLNGNFAGTGTDVSATLNFAPRAFQPVLYYLEAVHTTSTVNRLNVAVRAYPQTGLLASDTDGTGSDTTTLATTTPIPLSTFFVDIDQYLANARQPRVDV